MYAVYQKQICLPSREVDFGRLVDSDTIAWSIVDRDVLLTVQSELVDMRVLELYSGIGGMHYAFRESGIEGTIVASVDINNVANEVYKRNFPETQNQSRIIESFIPEEIKKLNINCILMSPPCQPFTRVGLKKDSLDNRACSLLHVLKLIPQIETLKYILVENVKGFEKSQVRDELVKCLTTSEFNYKELVLSPCQFGIPNTRHRYYLIAKKKGHRFYFDNSILIDYLPEEVLKILPESIYTKLADQDDLVNVKNNRKCYKLHHILDKDATDSKYLISKKLLEKYARVLDVRTAESNGSCCFTKAYGHYMEGTGSVFCPYSEKIFTAKYLESKTCENNSPEQLEFLADLKLRYFTPREVSRLMCFPEDFEFPDITTNKQKYRLLGNSINVHVVSRLIFLLNYEMPDV